MGTAAAAGTYPTDAVACGITETMLECMSAQLTGESACTALDKCQWISETRFEGTAYEETNTECAISDDLQDTWDYASANATAALATQLAPCQTFTAEADCAGSCAWGDDTEADDVYDAESGTWASPTGCFVSRSKAQTILIADGADPLSKGYSYYNVSDSTSCSTDGTTEVLCNVITACKWDDDDAKCEGDEVSAILLVNNKCQGSFSDTLLEYYNAAASTSLTTIAEVYATTSVPDETDSTLLAAQAVLAVAAATAATTAANTAADAMDTSTLSDDDAATFDFLVAAAITGETVTKIVATIDTTDATAACAAAFSGMGLESSVGSCTATAARRRKLLADYSTSVLLNPNLVDTAAAAAAVTALETDLGSDAVTSTDENPVDQIEALGVDSTEVATFRTAATAAAEANVEAEAYQAEEAAVDDDCAVNADGTVSCSGASSVFDLTALATALAAACVFA